MKTCTNRARRQTGGTQTAFDQALAALTHGDAGRSAQLCNEALRHDPTDGRVRVLLATALIHQGQFESAQRILVDVLRHFPDIPKANRELGHALLGQGKGKEAIEAFRRVTELTPEKAAAHLDLSIALTKIGHEDRAQRSLERSFQLDPSRRELADAMQLQREGRAGEAGTIYRDILQRDAANVNAARLLGVNVLAGGNSRLAVTLLRDAVRLAPDFFGARIDLARAFIENGDLDEAREILAAAICQQPQLAYPRMLLGNLLSKAGEYENALVEFEKALDLDPNHGASLSGMGHALKTIGRQDDAITAYRRCLHLYPSAGENYWSLANLKTFRFRDGEITEMEKHVTDEMLTEETRVNFNFALGKAYEDRGEFDRGFCCYQTGNALRRSNEHYDPVRTELVHDRIIECVSANFLQRHSQAGDPSTAPVFIVGLPRSGSTLIEQILASHNQVDGTHELPDLPQLIGKLDKQRPHAEGYPEALRHFSDDEFTELGSQYLLSSRRHRSGRAFFTDKMPNNFSSIGLLQLILPNARIINARRHPLDSCLGCYKQLFFRGQAFTYDLVEIGEYYLEYQRMMDHWHALLPGKILDVQYETMVLDQERQTHRLTRFCGLAWDDNCLQFYDTDRAINTASSEQVRQPMHSHSVNAWRRFEEKLRPLIDVLEPLLLKLPAEQRPGCLS